MRIKVTQLLSAKPALTKLSEARLQTRGAYRVMRLIKALNPEFEAIEETRMKIVRESCELDPSGNPLADQDGFVIFKAGVTREDFLAKNRELADSEIDVDVEPVRIALIDGVELSPIEMMALDPFIAGD